MRGDVAGCVVHSDRGSQLRSRKFLRALARHRMVILMSRVASCGDNAVMESVFSLLQKNILDSRSWTTRQELHIAIAIWIERTYHRRRRQSRLGRLTPIEYEAIMNTPATLAAWLETVTNRAAEPFAAKQLRNRKLLSSGPLVFPTGNDTVIATVRYQKWLRACARGTEFSQVTPHALRRTTASLLLAANPGTLFEVSRMPGHSSVSVTEKAYLSKSVTRPDLSSPVQELYSSAHNAVGGRVIAAALFLYLKSCARPAVFALFDAA